MADTACIMQARHRSWARLADWRGAMPVLTICLALIFVIIAAAERGVFTRLPAPASRIFIPGITVDDEDAGAQGTHMPVVTSLRSNSEAERLGVRVGDHIAAVDGRPIRDVAGLRAVVTGDRAHGPVALHILRGSAVWNVALDRAEPPLGADRLAVQER